MFPEQREILLPPYDGAQPLHEYVMSTTARLRHEYGEEWLVIAVGETARALPDLAFAFRAQHRKVVGYRIIDGILPPPNPEWPDAHVSYVMTQERDELRTQANQARLRGWDVIDQIRAQCVPVCTPHPER